MNKMKTILLLSRILSLNNVYLPLHNNVDGILYIKYYSFNMHEWAFVETTYMMSAHVSGRMAKLLKFEIFSSIKYFLSSNLKKNFNCEQKLLFGEAKIP